MQASSGRRKSGQWDRKRERFVDDAIQFRQKHRLLKKRSEDNASNFVYRSGLIEVFDNELWQRVGHEQATVFRHSFRKRPVE
jgi:hypothetical protein